ncbi:MAG: hypothetical protein IJ242_16300 [Clostridia bacterium]|nr:hypothetical protein [Clostridia bacterium]
MKRFLSLLLVTVFVSMPFSASAANWQDVLSNTVMSPDGTYSDGQTSGVYNPSEDSVSITGGVMDHFEIIETEEGFGNYLKRFDLNDLTITTGTGNQPYILEAHGGSITVNFNRVTFDGPYKLEAVSEHPDSTINLTFNGDTALQDRLQLDANDGARISVVNNGVMSFEGGESLSTGSILATVDPTSKISIENNGSIVPGVEGVPVSDTEIEYRGAYPIRITLHVDGAMPQNELIELAEQTFDIKGIDEGILTAWYEDENGDRYFIQFPVSIKQDMQSDWNPEWEPSPQERMAHEMEELRQAQACDNVTASPWWGYQLYMNYGSRNLWVRGKDGEKIFHKSVVVADGEHKNLVLRVMGETTDGVNIRYDASVLDYMDRYDIAKVTVVSESGEPYMTYDVSALRQAREQFGLAPEELLMVGGLEDEVMKGTDANGEFVKAGE